MGRQVQPVLIDRHWDVSSLLGETFKLFWRHAVLFLTITAIVAVPYVVVTDLVIGEDLTSDDPDFDVAAFVVPTILGATVVPALITALHVVALLRLAAGERPSVGEAYAMAFRRIGPVIATILLYIVVVSLGLVLLVLPGLWLAVRLYFGAQAAVVDELGPVDALKRSSDLVKNRFWQTVGRFLLAGIVFGLLTVPLTAPLSFMDFGAAYVVLDCVFQTILFSLSALFGTLVFLDYRSPEVPAYGGFEPPRAPTGQ